MAKFPGKTEIQFTERLPTGRSGSVTGRPDVRTGSQMIAQAFTNLGGQFQKISDARDKTELSTMRRQFDEMSFAAFNASALAADEEGRRVVTEQWSQDVKTIRSKSGTVNADFQSYLDNVQPEWAQNFARQEVKFRVEEIEAEKDANLASAYQNGDVKTVNSILDSMADFRQITRAEADQQKAEAPTTIVLTQSRILIGNGANAVAIDQLNALENLDGDQLDQRDKLLRMAQQQQQANGDAFGKELLKEGLGLTDLPTNARQAKIEELKNKALDPNNGLSLEQSRVMINWLDSQLAPSRTTTDWRSYDRVWKAVAKADSEESIRQAKNTFYEEAPNLAQAEQKELMKRLLEAESPSGDDPLKTSAAQRAFATLGAAEALLTPTTDAGVEAIVSPEEFADYEGRSNDQKTAIRGILGKRQLSQQRTDLELWLKVKPRTPQEIQDYIDKALTLPKQEDAGNWFTRSLGFGSVFQPSAEGRSLQDIITGFPDDSGPTSFKFTATNHKTGERLGRNSKTEPWQPIP